MISKYIQGNALAMAREDHARFFVRDPQGFSAEYNNYVVEQTITEYEAMREKQAKSQDKAFEERADAVVTFLRAVDRGKEPDLNRYFGRKMLAHLAGQNIREKLLQKAFLAGKLNNRIIPSY